MLNREHPLSGADMQVYGSGRACGRNAAGLLAMAPAPPRLLLFARHGFTRELTAAAAAHADLELIDLSRLYAGS
jgi:hypothetical protein